MEYKGFPAIISSVKDMPRNKVKLKAKGSPLLIPTIVIIAFVVAIAAYFIDIVKLAFSLLLPLAILYALVWRHNIPKKLKKIIVREVKSKNLDGNDKILSIVEIGINRKPLNIGFALFLETKIVAYKANGKQIFNCKYENISNVIVDYHDYTIEITSKDDKTLSFITNIHMSAITDAEQLSIYTRVPYTNISDINLFLVVAKTAFPNGWLVSPYVTNIYAASDQVAKNEAVQSQAWLGIVSHLVNKKLAITILIDPDDETKRKKKSILSWKAKTALITGLVFAVVWIIIMVMVYSQ